MSATIDPELRRALIEIVDERVREIEVHRSDFVDLKEAVTHLTTAQVRTEEALKGLTERMDELAASQKRTDESVKELAASQRRTDESVKELAASQKQTDESVKELAASQMQTDVLLKELVMAQKQTEKALKELAEAQMRTDQQVGRLGDNLGFGLEDIARVVAPGYLLRHHGIEMGEFERRYLKINGRGAEIDLYAEGQRNHKKVIVLGEVKSRIHPREVKKFARVLDELKPHLGSNVFSLMFAYWIHPAASLEAKKRDIELIASYQR